MVSSQATQPAQPPHPRPTDWKRDSVRITAHVSDELRRRILRDHYQEEYDKQAIVSAFECNDLKILRRQGRPTAQAELRASNAAAVLQRIADNLAAYTDNRDFGFTAVAK